MKLKMLTGIVLGAMIAPIALASAPHPGDFGYERSVILPANAGGDTEIVLEPEVLQKVSENFSNLTLVNDKNEELPFSLFSDPVKKWKKLKVVETSSEKGGNPTKNLVDNDPFTEFYFDERVDRKNDSWILLDLGELVPISRLKVLPTDMAKIRFVEIKAGPEPDKLKTYFSKKDYRRYVDLSTPLVRYVKVSLWGISVKLVDVQVYTNQQVSLYFSSVPGERYRLLYGGNKTDSIRYKEQLTGRKLGNIPVVTLSKEKFNSVADKDYDGDGVDNIHDNCPFVSNSLQGDKDDDRVGNKCDNAKTVKNFNQFDTDRDGVGDVIDNCKLEKNPDQGNRDNDEFGDACDSAHAVDTSDKGRSLDTKRTFIGITLVLLGLFSFFFYKKFWYNKKK